MVIARALRRSPSTIRREIARLEGQPYGGVTSFAPCAAADDRRTVGHWEGDRVIGQAKSSQAVGVLYERTTRRIRLCKLERHDALTTYKRFARALRGVLPDTDRRSGPRKGGTSAADSGPRDSGVLLPSA